MREREREREKERGEETLRNEWGRGEPSQGVH